MSKPRLQPDLPHPCLQRALDFVSSRISEPVDKLWFINRTLQAFEQRPESLKRLPVVRSLLFHHVLLQSLGELIRHHRPGRVALPRSPIWLLYRLRHVVLTLAVVGIAYGSFRAAAYGFPYARGAADWVAMKLIPEPVAATTSAPPAYPSTRIGAPPAAVWLVERDETEELWSNGLRVITSFETEGKSRDFFAFPRDGSAPVPMGDKPVGIVYHASQSDMAPLSPRFNREILSTTRDLMGWLSRREIYHYVIDRFGQVYRIVHDDQMAVHAGVSVWGDSDYYYLNLNDSFIGVAFESQWSTAGEVITSAQLQAAVNLTDVLRARYGIADVNCVPHGLVSVNASKKLIGYHADWARNFPFAALGLANNYRVPPPSITAFGFRYDEDLIDRLGGELWPGVHLAEQELIRRARDSGETLSALRARLQRRYRENLELARLAGRSSAGTRLGAARGTADGRTSTNP